MSVVSDCMLGLVFSIILLCSFFFFKQKTAYEMRISDWSSDVCSSDLRDSPMAVNTISWKTVERWTQGLIDQECREIRAAFVGDGVTAPQEIGRASWRERVCQYV